MDLSPGDTEHTAHVDQPLVRSCASDDRTVSMFEDFYAAHRVSIGRALAITLRDEHLAADALDEAMARAFQRWDQVQQLSSPSGWVYTVGLNWSRSAIRRSSRHHHVAGRDTGDEFAGANRFSDPDVDRALRDLSVEQRAVVVCRYLIGYSESETATVLGIRPGTVKSRLSRALDRLRWVLTTADDPVERAGR